MRSGGRRQIDEIDSLGGPTQFFVDDRPAAPRQRIGHYQRPCSHSPASILIHPQYRIFANIADAIHVYLAETFRAAAGNPEFTLDRAVVEIEAVAIVNS